MKNTQSRIICESHGYVAAVAGYRANNGPFLSVTRGASGKYLAGETAQQWVEALESSLDKKEQAALCRAIYNA